MSGKRASDERHPVTGTSASGPTPAQELTEALAEVRAGRRDAYGRVVELCQSRLLSFTMSLLKDYAEEVIFTGQPAGRKIAFGMSMWIRTPSDWELERYW